MTQPSVVKSALPAAVAGLARRRDRAFGDGAELFYDAPVHIERGDGVWLYDVDGTRYLDLYNNVPCVGHANPRVASAVGEQMATLNVHSRYLHAAAVEYAERVVGLHDDGFESMVTACSGTEANEVAVMMARTATGARGIICTDSTYHGNSLQIGAMTSLPVGETRHGVRSITAPETYRPPRPGWSVDDLCDHYVAELESTIEGLERDGLGFAALMICPIFANEGLPDVPAGYLRRAVDVVHDAGGLVIADEVQAGFCRTGSWWGYQYQAIPPDIVTMGKPMGNGVPVSGVVASHELVTAFRSAHHYFNTYAASPIQAAAGNAVIDEIVDRDLRSSVVAAGTRLLEGLTACSDPRIGDVRGRGLFLAVEWVVPGTTEPDPTGAHAMVEELKRRGMLVGTDGPHASVIKIRPPLVFGVEHADLFLDAFAAALTALPAE